MNKTSVEYRKNRIGQTNINRYGSEMKVIEYNNAMDIIVKFEKGEPIHTTWGDFIRGNIRNVYDKSVYGVGYIGEGKYKPNVKDKDSHQYTAWRGMLSRCYDHENRHKYPTYKNCTVCEEWHNFQNFAKWYDENYYQVNEERMHLDKDILIKGNKVYSPETCVFVPERINILFLKSNAKRGKYPIGVTLLKISEQRPYQASCSIGKGKRKYLKTYSTPEEAFYAYKTFKESYIKEIAEKYKDKIPSKLYEVMINYIVEIND